MDCKWNSAVRLFVMQNGVSIPLVKRDFSVGPLGKTVLNLEATLPTHTGPCTLIAELTDQDGRRVRSLRDVTLGR